MNSIFSSTIQPNLFSLKKSAVFLNLVVFSFLFSTAFGQTPDGKVTPISTAVVNMTELSRIEAAKGFIPGEIKGEVVPNIKGTKIGGKEPAGKLVIPEYASSAKTNR